MNDTQQPGPEYKSDAIQCTIVNQTSGAIQYNKSSKTGGNLNILNNTLDPGGSLEMFEAQGPGGWPSGCGGQVVYNLPNGQDRLVVIYNVSVTGQSSQVFAELQNQSGQRAGCDAYFVVVSNGSANATHLAPTLTVYNAGASASPVTGYVDPSGVQITIENQLDTWITLNSFPNPKWDIMPIVTDATTSVAPGTSAVALSSAEAYKFTLIYNITAEYLLTIQQHQGDPPTAGFNASCPYTATVSGGEIDKKTFSYAYTVTVSPAGSS